MSHIHETNSKENHQPTAGHPAPPHNTNNTMRHTITKLGTKRAPLTFLIAALAGITTVAFAADGGDAKPKKKKKKEEAKAVVAPETVHYGKKASESFFKRLNEAFAEQSATAIFTPAPPPKPGVPPPPPSRRIGDPPFDGPPYPTQEWQIGGGPNVIGDPGALRDSPYPLMQAIYDGPHGKGWYDSRIQFYGWETIGGNLSTSHNTSAKNTAPGPNANFPMAYDIRPNRVEQEQFVLYIERMADMNQTDHIDWGFRIAGVYGMDYRFMVSRGYLDRQINGNLQAQHNNYAGFDMPMMYFNLYIPQVAQGMNIIIGRIISMPDIEQQLAPNNLMASHSITYSFDDYTLWGIWATIKLNARWTVQTGIACGVDLAPWQSDQGRQPTGCLLLQYISPGGHDSFYGGMNSVNDGAFGYNNLQECIFSYTHKFNDLWWTTFEFQYMYMRGCTTGPTHEVPFQNGFYPKKAGFVAEGGLVNYTCRRLANNAFLTIRNEWYDDGQGARTGFASHYYEGSVGITWFPNRLLCIRPEIRYERSMEATAYNNGTRHNQLTFGCDVTYHF
jgi:hypothetical protein